VTIYITRVRFARIYPRRVFLSSSSSPSPSVADRPQQYYYGGRYLPRRPVSRRPNFVHTSVPRVPTSVSILFRHTPSTTTLAIRTSHVTAQIYARGLYGVKTSTRYFVRYAFFLGGGAKFSSRPASKNRFRKFYANSVD